MEKSDQDHAAGMLAMSRMDLAALEHMLDSAKFPDAIFGFHAQQAIEKALKAWIASLARNYPKSHDLMTLVRILAAAGKNLESYYGLESFTAFAAQYRYQPYDRKDQALDREATLVHVRRLVAEVAAATGADSTEHAT